MNTLTSMPLAPLLDRLFAEAEAAGFSTMPPAAAAYWNGLSDEEKAQTMRSKTGYREFYAQMKDLPLPVSRETGVMLHMLARSNRATSIVEFGTSFGLSTLYLAAALRDNGGGRLITSEFEPAKVARARANLEAAGLADLVEFREGDALETLARDLPEAIDLVLLDGAKGLYSDILDRLEPRLRPGSLIVADNADYCPEYLGRVRDPAQGYLSVPFADDVELSMKLG
ncbi:MAG: O-methyltransferase [Novosphingobium sp.]|nr:O-methyltransferase [Novosphingobium sp.]